MLVDPPRHGRLFDDSWRDLRLAFRTLRSTPIVTVVAIASLALGIGANTAIFSIINSLLLRPLPVRDPSSLVLVTDGSPSHVRAWSYPIWEQVRQRPALFEQSAAWSFTRFNLASGGETQFAEGMWAGGAFFETLGVSPLIGRALSDADDRLGAPPVAMISYGFWQRRFGGAADVVGRSLTCDGVVFSIVGVTPRSFSGPEVGRAFDVIVPLANEPATRGKDSFLDSSGVTFLTIIARLRPDQSVDSATAGLRQVQVQIREATLGDTGRFGSRTAIERYLKSPFVLAPGATGYSGARDLRGLYERPLLTILVVVVLLLCIACVNVGNLMISRAIARRHELSLRLALGASRWRLVRQLLAETVVLYGLGGTCGAALAAAGSRVLVRQISTRDPVSLDVSLDPSVLAFTVLMTVLTTLLFGTLPAFSASRRVPIDALKQQRRGAAEQELGRLAGGLIVMQLALSVILVVAAGLFIRTFVSLANRPLGFEPSHVLVVNVDAHHVANDTGRRIAVYEHARDAVRALPDVEDAVLSLTTPIGAGQFTPLVDIAGVFDTHGPVWANLISPGWLATLRMPLVAGRDLTDGDRAGAPRAAIVNEAFARLYADGGSPIGRTMTLYPRTPRAMGPIEIVGVVGDSVYASLRSPAPPTFYLPLAQFDYLTDLGIRTINLSVRSRTASPLSLTRSVTAAVASVDPQLALTFRPLATQVSAALQQERLIAWLSGFFGALALMLAALGLYGVMAHAVASRRFEIGIRMALGATASRAVRLVLARTSLMVGIGLFIGAAMSLWAAKFVTAMIYGIEPRDPVTVATSLLMLAIVAGGAAWFPTRRAARTDPAAVLREG